MQPALLAANSWKLGHKDSSARDVSWATCFLTWGKTWCYNQVSCLAPQKSATPSAWYTTSLSWNGISTETDGERQQPLEASGTGAFYT